MKRYGILFNGQGSQSIGMGHDFYEAFPYLQERVHEASRILGYDLKEVLYKENEKINDTLYTQPAILVTSLIIYEALVRETGIKGQLMAGFSLGEYSALCAGGVFDFKTIVELIKERARLMEEASTEKSGMMAAVIGMDQAELTTICGELSTSDEFVQIANFNCPGQLVVSGTKEKVLELQTVLKDKARRFIPLNVSGGFHTALMHTASREMGKLVAKSQHQAPYCPLIMNATAEALDYSQLRELMEKQIESPVLFEDSLRLMMNQVDGFIEIGPGKVLSGFVRKMDRQFPVITINTVNDLSQMISESGE